ncbi:protein phosphatase 2C [Niveomyces insectorum RCEF 264]|uniref:Protein phosphatase 2C n=1 Tax=Niveomyces insectorum RCEF 264 TaxID=1081102 RepID=A0A167WT64_9HYPO|nr:protein phosphatase 2C [Niveomyces insectorum RCEF 264]
MFGGSSSSVIKPEGAIDDAGTDADAKGAGNRDDPGGSGGDGRNKSPSPPRADGEQKMPSSKPIPSTEKPASNEKRAGNNSPPASGSSAEQKKRRSSGVSSRASSLLASAKNSLSFSQTGRFGSDATSSNQTPLQKLGKQDAALAVPQGQHNNSAGESVPGPRSTFRVGVWEDRNKKCRRTMEDTHAFLYNFLRTPAPAPIGTGTGTSGDKDNNSTGSGKPAEASESDAAPPDDSSSGGADAGETSLETDNGYFAIFDGHAGTFAADWCGKKLHLVLEDIIRKNPNVPVPELLDQTFTSVDAQLEKLPLKNSGCTAAIAVLRWEDRVPSNQSATGSQGIAVAAAARANEEAAPRAEEKTAGNSGGSTGTSIRSIDVEAAHAKLKPNASRQRVLYTANVGDARIILCRSGKALRLSYDHKGSDENEGRRIANAGGLILNNRVNGVLAVTRALGDTYIKDLVTGHPYTTETVIQPDIDEFMIIACDGLWDVCSDQDAVNLVRSVQDPVAAAKMLVDHALAHFSTDNLSCMIVRFDREALAETQKNKDGLIGVEGDEAESAARPSEADKIVSTVKQKIAEGGTPAVGVSASNSGHGHESTQPAATATVEDAFKRTAIEGSVEEEPASASASSALESTLDGSGRATEPEDTLREPGTKPATESGSKS